MTTSPWTTQADFWPGSANPANITINQLAVQGVWAFAATISLVQSAICLPALRRIYINHYASFAGSFLSLFEFRLIGEFVFGTFLLALSLLKSTDTSGARAVGVDICTTFVCCIVVSAMFYCSIVNNVEKTRLYVGVVLLQSTKSKHIAEIYRRTLSVQALLVIATVGVLAAMPFSGPRFSALRVAFWTLISFFIVTVTVIVIIVWRSVLQLMLKGVALVDSSQSRKWAQVKSRITRSLQWHYFAFAWGAIYFCFGVVTPIQPYTSFFLNAGFIIASSAYLRHPARYFTLLRQDSRTGSKKDSKDLVMAPSSPRESKLAAPSNSPRAKDRLLERFA